MSRRTRGKPHPWPTEWEPEREQGDRLDEKMRLIALSRPPCHVCGGIPQRRAVRVVHVAFKKSWRWFLCGPCQERLENGELIGHEGLGVC